MNNSGQILLYILLLVISLAMGNWFYNNFKWVTKDTEVGFQGIAQTNKLLASEFFLRKMGVKVQQVNGLIAFRDLPSVKHTLLIATQRETINKELSQKLLNWIRAGGHLIVEAREIENDDSLLEQFSIFSEDSLCGCNEDEEDSADNVIENALAELASDDIEDELDESSDEEDEEEIPVQFSLNSSVETDQKKTEIKVYFPEDISLQKTQPEPKLNWLVEDNLGKYLMQFHLDKGLLTVLSSTTIFDNEAIAEHDHARFLLHLVQQPGHDEGVWLIRVDDMPPLWKWLWKNAWYVMFSLTLLFIFWLWKAPLRFGPILNDEQLERRSLIEHIQASGYYRWHNNQSGYLLSKVQDALWDKIQSAHPAVRRENQTQAFMKLEEITGIKASLIKQSLMVVDKIDEQGFLEKIRMLEMIRKHL